MEKGIEGIQNSEYPKEGLKYDFPEEEYLNPGKREISSEKIHEEIEKNNTNIAYQNEIGNVFEQEVLSKKMSDSDIDALAASMVEKYDTSAHELQELENSEILEEEEIENKEEIIKQKEGESSVFSRAVEILKEYLMKHPKVAKIAMVGMLASELNGAANAGNHHLEGMVYSGVSGMQQLVYSQMQGQQQYQHNAIQGQQQSQYNAIQGEQQAEYVYQRNIQTAENERQKGYQQLDNYILQLRSRGQENKASRDIFMKRGQIENRYNQRVYDAQVNYQRNQEQIAMRQQQIQNQTQMRAQQIQMQTQRRQQQIQMNTGARIMNQAIHGMLQGVRR